MFHSNQLFVLKGDKRLIQATFPVHASLRTPKSLLYQLFYRSEGFFNHFSGQWNVAVFDDCLLTGFG